MVRRAAWADQAGESLVEIMLTVAIMGIAMVGLLTGVGTAIRLSGTHRAQANTGVALTTAAEAVKTYVAPGAPTCSTNLVTLYTPALSGLTLPGGWSSTNLAITSATCANVNGVALPKVTVKATAPNSQASESVEVVRRSVK